MKKKILRFALLSVLLSVACAVSIGNESNVFNIVRTSIGENHIANPDAGLNEMEVVENYDHHGNVSTTFTWGKRQKRA